MTTTIDIAKAYKKTIASFDLVVCCLISYEIEKMQDWNLNAKSNTMTIIMTNKIYATTLLKKEQERFYHITSRGPGACATTMVLPLNMRRGVLKGESNLFIKVFNREFSYWLRISTTVFC